MDLYSSLCTITKEENILRDEPMCRHTTFRVGGPADYFVTPQSVEEIRGILAVCRKENVPYYIVGNGSNLLVGDGGFRGVVLQIFKKMNDVRVEGERVTAQAGVLLSKVASAAYNASLTGLEFAAGIPGTLGGAVRMNAGAYGGEMKQVLESAVVLTQEGGTSDDPGGRTGTCLPYQCGRKERLCCGGGNTQTEKGRSGSNP